MRDRQNLEMRIWMGQTGESVGTGGHEGEGGCVMVWGRDRVELGERGDFEIGCKNQKARGRKWSKEGSDSVLKSKEHWPVFRALPPLFCLQTHSLHTLPTTVYSIHPHILRTLPPLPSSR